MSVSSLSAADSQKISCLSLVAAIMVVYIHVPHTLTALTPSSFAMNLLSEGICNVAVPFFFVVSGFMLARHCGEDGWWRCEVKKRLRTVLIPYVIWYLVLSAMGTACAVVANHAKHAELFSNLSCLYPFNFLGLNPFGNPPAPLWFLRSLMFFVAISPVVMFFTQRNGRKCAVAFLCALFAVDLFLISYVCPVYRFWNSFFRFFLSFNGLFYFSFGCYLARGGGYRQESRSRWRVCR